MEKTYNIKKEKLSEVSDISVPDLIAAKYNPNIDVIVSIERKDKAKFVFDDVIVIGKYLKDSTGYENNNGILYYTDKIEGKSKVVVKLIYTKVEVS